MPAFRSWRMLSIAWYLRYSGWMANCDFPMRQAVVIGGSIAGILAARVLADHFEQVTVVERDRFPDGPFSRRGTPHDRHLHALLGGGLRIMDRLFPGFDAELAAAGGVNGDVCNDAAYFLPTGRAPRFATGIRVNGASRRLIEWTLRQRLRAVNNVSFVENLRVTGLLSDSEGSVRGALGRSDAATRDVDADLVVDASGRASRAPEWLQTLGYERPPENVVDSSIAYVSCRFKRPPDDPGWKALFVFGDPRRNPRYGVISPEEDGRWVVGLAGASGVAPEADEAGVLSFARELRSPLLYDAISRARLLGPVLSYRNTMNRVRRYERLRRWPERFVVLGDAVAVLNPIYGQGMTLAAIGAITLGEMLAEHGNREGLAKRFQRRLALANRIPWLLATSQDLRHGGTAPFLTWTAQLYTDRLMARMPTDPIVTKAFFQAVHLVDQTAFLRPRIVARGLMPALKRRPAILAGVPPPP